MRKTKQEVEDAEDGIAFTEELIGLCKKYKIDKLWGWDDESIFASRRNSNGDDEEVFVIDQGLDLTNEGEK